MYQKLIVDNMAKPNEIFNAVVPKDYVFDDVLFVGDKRQKIPDIQISNENIGIEVVQIELEKDLDVKKIWKKYYECNGNINIMKNFAKEKII